MKLHEDASEARLFNNVKGVIVAGTYLLYDIKVQVNLSTHTDIINNYKKLH